MWHERTTEHIHHRSLPSVRNFSMPGTGNENRRIPGSYVRLRRRHYPVYKDTHRLYFQTSQIQEQETKKETQELADFILSKLNS